MKILNSTEFFDFSELEKGFWHLETPTVVLDGFSSLKNMSSQVLMSFENGLETYHQFKKWHFGLCVFWRDIHRNWYFKGEPRVSDG